MKTASRLISLFIAIAFIISFPGCGNKSEKSSSDDSYLKIDEDNIDLKGRTITVQLLDEKLIPQEDESKITDEGQKKLNEVTLVRQKEAEKKFNCNVEWKLLTQDDLKNMLSYMKAGQLEGDIVLVDLEYGSNDMVINNLIESLDDYIDFNTGEYANNAQNQAVWKGKHYGIIPATEEYIPCLYYNKKMLANEGLEDPYELMKKGQWTWDVFLDMLRKTTKDTNGDDIIDQWGLDGDYSTLYNRFIYSNGGDYIKEEDNQYKQVLDSEETKEAVKFVTDLYKTDKVVYDRTIELIKSGTSNKNINITDLQISYVDKGIAAFSTLEASGNENVEIGKVCYPKGPNAYDYITYRRAGRFYAIPSTVEDPKGVAAVMACLFSYYDKTKEEYLDINSDSDDYDLTSVNIKYSWFMDDYNYAQALREMYMNILLKDKSVDESISTAVMSVSNKVAKLNMANN